MKKYTSILSLAGIAIATPILAGPFLVGGANAQTAEPKGATAVEQQSGIVLECVGDHVQAFVYENSLHGNSVQIVMAGRDGEMIGSTEQAEPFLVDGFLTAVADVEGTEVTIDGTVVESGRPTKVVEPIQDGGQQIVSRGTNTPLAADLTVRYHHSEFPLDCSPAFAFELQTRSTDLYGG